MSCSTHIVNCLHILQVEPDRLALRLQYPLNVDAEFTPASESLELAVCVETLSADGVWEPRTKSSESTHAVWVVSP